MTTLRLIMSLGSTIAYAAAASLRLLPFVDCPARLSYRYSPSPAQPDPTQPSQSKPQPLQSGRVPSRRLQSRAPRRVRGVLVDDR